MSTQVIAKDGDSLCGIAIAAGFLNCAALRAEGANSALLSRPLKAGDIVTVPDLRKKDLSKPTDGKHSFKKKNSPPVSVRFVHGSPDKKYLDDTTLTVLDVSNFPTDVGGSVGDAAGSFPTGFGFDQHGHDDVDTFKVEVHDPGAGGTVNAKLEAVKPVKQADGSIQFQPITGVPDADLRKSTRSSASRLPAATSLSARSICGWSSTSKTTTQRPARLCSRPMRWTQATRRWRFSTSASALPTNSRDAPPARSAT